MPEESWRSQYREEDERWSPRNQVRDWLWLLVMIAVYVGVHMIVYALEPGLR